jgi:glycosyltransferase involved in cell wall biosynthesis
MKIAHLISHDALNGVATSTKTLVDNQIKAGHEVMLIHPRKSWIERQKFAGPVKMLQSSFRTNPTDLRNTGYPIRDWGRTLVHAHGSRANKFLMIFTIADGAPAVMTAHTRQFQIPWRFAHAVVGLSRQTADYYIKRLLVSPSRMHIVPNMFDSAALQPVSPEARNLARQKLGIRENTFLLGSVGLIGVRKRQIDMLAILKQLLEKGIDAELMLVGGLDGKEGMPGWHAALKDPILNGKVHLVGPREDAVELVAAMDLFLCTSIAEEAPIAPLEAMAQAIPAISTDVGNMEDLLPADRLFTVGDVDGLSKAAERFARNPQWQVEAGAADRQKVTEQLAPEAMLPQIEDIYLAALSRARDRGWKYFKNPADRWVPGKAR